MEYLILTTISGSAICLAFLGWEKLFRNFLTQRMRYRALKLILLVYVVPWVWLKDFYGYILEWLMPIKVPVITRHPVVMAEIITEEEAYTTNDYRWRLIIIAIWLLVAMVLLIRKARIYFKDRNRFVSVAMRFEESDVNEMVLRLRSELRYKGKMRIYRTPVRGHTFTLGAIKPIIFLQEEYADDQLYFVLKHEMLHVVKKDLLFKLIMEFACCLHWFNYLVYALNGRFDEVCEQSCDERVLRGCSQDMYKAYAKLLADNFIRHGRSSEQRMKIPFQSGFDDDLDKVMERINLIISAKEKRSWKKKLAGSVFALLLLANSLMAMAYPNIYHVHNGDSVAEEVIDGEAFWMNDEVKTEFDYDHQISEVVYESEFIDEEGNIYPVNSCQSHIFCDDHDIMLGKFQMHEKDDGEGCTIIIYQGRKCNICDNIWLDEWINTSSCVKCPH